MFNNSTYRLTSSLLGISSKINKPFSCSTLLLNNKNSNNYISKHEVHHAKYAIVGGGTGGMTICSSLLRNKICNEDDIVVFDPSKLHWYQPSFTMVSAGLLGDNDSAVTKHVSSGIIHRPIEHVFNEHVKIVPDSVTEYDPNENAIFTSKGEKFVYDHLIIASGMELRYDLIEGLQDALDDPASNVGSMFTFEYAKKINRLRANFKGGKVIAYQPPMPIKCGGAPQKWLYLSEYSFRKKGIRDKCQINFYTALPVMFPVKKYSDALQVIAGKKNIQVFFQHELIKVDSNLKKAYFKNLKTNEIVEDDYDLLHVPPPQKAPKILAAAKLLVNPQGYVNVNERTLQHVTYPNVWSLGDCSSLPTSKTAAGIFSQAPVLIHNIVQYNNKSKLNAIYDGYTSCPLFVGDNKLMLMEFVYGNNPKESFRFIDQAIPRHAFYHLKRYVFPFVYWNFAPRGRWFGRTAIIAPKFLQGRA